MFQLVLERVDALGEVDERLHIGDLAADVEVQPHIFDVGETPGVADGGEHVVHRQAKLVFVQSRGDFGVGVGIHVGIDAESHTCRLPHLSGNGVDVFQFRQTLHIEAGDAYFEGEPYLPISFAHTGKHNLVGREALGKSSAHFAAAHAVGPEPGLGDGAQDGRRGTSLDGIVDVAVGEVAGRSEEVIKCGSQ